MKGFSENLCLLLNLVFKVIINLTRQLTSALQNMRQFHFAFKTFDF